MDWQDFHIVAEQLSKSDREADQRTAISRAYYAVFNLSKERFEKHRNIKLIPNDRGSHQMVWDALRDDGDQNLRMISNVGTRMKKNRKLADYINPFPRSVRISTALSQSIWDANSCIRLLNEHFP